MIGLVTLAAAMEGVPMNGEVPRPDLFFKGEFAGRGLVQLPDDDLSAAVSLPRARVTIQAHGAYGTSVRFVTIAARGAEESWFPRIQLAEARIDTRFGVAAAAGVIDDLRMKREVIGAGRRKRLHEVRRRANWRALR